MVFDTSVYLFAVPQPKEREISKTEVIMSTSQHPSDTPAKGWLSNIAGKAFSIASVAALCLPLVGLGQAVGIVPGSYHADSYRDIGASIVQMIEDYKAPQEALAEHGAVLISPDGFQESYFGYDDTPAFKVDDTHITGLEGVAALGAGALFGTAGIVAAGVSRGGVGEDGEIVAPLGKIVLPLAAIDIIGGDSPSGDAASAALAGMALAVAGTFAAAATGGSYYLGGRSFYENFIRDDKAAPSDHDKAVKSASEPAPTIA